MIVLITITALLLDGIITNYISSTSIFIPLLTITSLIIIYPYFKDKYKYYKYAAIIGFLYDIAYSNTILYNLFIFLFLCLIIKCFYYYFNNTIYTSIILVLIIITFYRLITILFMFLSQDIYINYRIIFKSIYSSILINIIYLILCYYGSLKYSKKHNIFRMK